MDSLRAMTAPIRLSIITPLIYVGWVMVWRVRFRLRRPTWVPWLTLALALLMLSSSIGQNLFFVLIQPGIGEDVPYHLAHLARLHCCLLIWTVFQGIVEQGLEGWIAVPAVLLAGVAEFSVELNYFHISAYLVSVRTAAIDPASLRIYFL